MRSICLALRSAALLATLCGVTTVAVSAQTFAASVGTVAPPMHVGDSGLARPSIPGHHRGAEEKLIYARVRDGVYTVDGLVGKVRLNYDVQGVQFLYMFVPGIGTAVLSVAPDGDAVVAPAALQGEALSFDAGGHHFTLTGLNLESDRGQAPSHLYVRLDRTAWHLGGQPMVGYGNRPRMPYEWPGALPPDHPEESREVPPLPISLLPKTAPVTTAAQSPTAVSPAALRPMALR